MEPGRWDQEPHGPDPVRTQHPFRALSRELWPWVPIAAGEATPEAILLPEVRAPALCLLLRGHRSGWTAFR